jgi:hypothetical protein
MVLPVVCGIASFSARPERIGSEPITREFSSDENGRLYRGFMESEGDP